MDLETQFEIENLLVEIKNTCKTAGGVIDTACPDLFVDVEDYFGDIIQNCKRIMDLIQED